MKRLLCLLPLLLASCGVVAPPRDRAQWSTSLYGVEITWRWVNPGTLGTTPDGQPYAGYTLTTPLGDRCVVDLDPALAQRDSLTHVAAHEAGHCLAARSLRLGGDPGRPGAYYQQLLERWPEAYAQAYLRACGDSLRPLGWVDSRAASCEAPPDPRSVPAGI